MVIPMLIAKILGLIDILSALFFYIFGMFGFISPNIVMAFGVILLVKGLIFIWGFNIFSAIDVISGIVIIMGASGVVIPEMFVIVISIFLLGKGAFSML